MFWSQISDVQGWFGFMWCVKGLCGLCDSCPSSGWLKAKLSYLRTLSIAELGTGRSWIISCGFANGLVYNAETKGGSSEPWKQLSFLWPGPFIQGAL